MAAYYNEFDPKTAAWLRELIKRGLIAPGDVDERSIKDVQPDDLKGYTQVHLFAGIGGWSYALRLAGWSDDIGVWTGSCPCQPFSSAGKRRGTDDERHLWPEMLRLIDGCRPQCVFGEQVASAVGHGWLDGVFADLEAEGYACGAVVLGAHSVGAPNIRQRLWWVAESAIAGSWSQGPHHEEPQGWRSESGRESVGVVGRLADAQCSRAGPVPRGMGTHECEAEGSQPESRRPSERTFDSSPACVVGDPSGTRPQERICERRIQRRTIGPSPWQTFELASCRDGKARRFEPGSFPLAHGVPARVVRLRGYGNAINPFTAAEFIQAYIETKEV